MVVEHLKNLRGVLVVLFWDFILTAQIEIERNTPEET
jgi:hypothetical protein